MIAVPCPVGWGVDLDSPVTPSIASALKQAGAIFVVRYLGDVSSAELATILGAGLLFCPVAHPREAGWAAQTGNMDGQAMAIRAQRLGLPEAIHLWIDAEGQGGLVVDWTAYLEACGTALVAKGYLAGAYEGAGVPLSGAQWYALASISGYWESCSLVPRVSTCGPMIQQWHHDDVSMFGAVVDLDFVGPDRKGRFPVMVGAA